MNSVLIDTNILIDVLRSHRKSRPKNKMYEFNSKMAVSLIDKLIDERVNRYISCHSIKELLQYPYISLQEENRIQLLLPTLFRVLPTNQKVARTAGLLSRQSAEYRDYHIEDCYIAATAIVNDLPLYTRNPDDFKFVPHPALEIVVPYQYSVQASF
ncbi:PilT protein domain protein [Desulfofarcimen acetoxidans DSM 771]|uniref:PilT protein domain protein n=1 Tax=Desulfofarcimen acetoxidans (strain ATCC 49208 / DSM 771 / KCTC 5769 / VKM B-1644 / 5575) TaxID=485916 RepID=C8VYL8_DESAS|nr:PIN domain-containing protein [Desulfofarcimen acetoxidans]ACV64739.1 PilT protein domain protein [Desulfofarcimen acetoxidans DSM 771]